MEQGPRNPALNKFPGAENCGGSGLVACGGSRMRKKELVGDEEAQKRPKATS